MAKKGKMSGKTKAAILLIALGPERSAKLFSHMHDDEIEELTLEIANVNRITPEEREMVLEEFYQVCLAQEFISEGGINYAKEVLEKAMGSQKALEIINKLTSSLQVKPFDFVKKTDANQLLNFIQNEHPQTLALILSYLNPSQAAQVLSALPQEKQADVAQRIATMESTSPEIIKEVELVLERKLSSMVTQDYSATGGIQCIVDILNSVDRGTEKYILETLEIQNAELVEEIRKKMFVFEDIVNLDSVGIQRFIREVDNNDLAVALKGATDEVKEMIFANMSKRMAEMLREDMDFMGPVRLRDVEEAQQKIVNIIRKLEEANEIIIARGGGDELIV
ncbi:MAG: flagellar motor switch protein FliG [Clostridiales bacterium]|jgi:flagellar motor switch protein FliG|uniref:Flagellar motor switch protein FliG n=1 Tax=Fusibacter paucivorans TaxID=76009 RepID=A0ABS5PTH8_9FIRM|nr:flagellar motor switch protein FliG [Fusibacter paucivorans]MBS7528393.1 flagellar motor switch protein FliG [Fusibacter paucivorans]MDK2867436.1 flagellar motor switch protein FliG [Clostridiales bacterium]MDN5299647.1 flagellar motor switch protein FliG [Clostridiales bacterium]